MLSLEDFRKIVPDKTLAEIYHRAKNLYGKHIVHVNSTYMGGGVAEILYSRFEAASLRVVSSDSVRYVDICCLRAAWARSPHGESYMFCHSQSLVMPHTMATPWADIILSWTLRSVLGRGKLLSGVVGGLGYHSRMRICVAANADTAVTVRIGVGRTSYR